MITKRLFGKVDEKEVYAYLLDNSNGFSAEIITYGGIVRTLNYKGKDVVLGYDTIEDYQNNPDYFGALIGRNSNRIEGASFTLGGVEYKLFANDNRSNLHGGKVGFNSRIWDAEAIDGEEPALKLSLFSPDMEEGFPGNLNVTVTYTLTKDNSLDIHYEAVSDKDTVVNLTNHSYFNLNGHESGNVDNHTLMFNSSFYTPNTDECIPYGEVLSVNGTAFDMRKPTRLGDVFASNDEQVKMFGGIDHNIVIDGSGMRLCAEYVGDISKIKMQVYTDLPAIQLYTGNNLKGNRVAKGGIKYPLHGAICLETQTFPNNLKYTHFPTSIVKANEKYETLTKYKFI